MDHPELAKYFFNEADIETINVPKGKDDQQFNTIFYHWEKAASRMIQSMSKVPASWIFNQPVDPEKLQIPDYF